MELRGHERLPGAVERLQPQGHLQGAMKTTLLYAAAVAAWLTCPSSSFAQAPPDAKAAEGAPANEEMVEVHVIGDRDDALQKVPGSGTVIDVEHPSGVGGQVAYAFVGPQFADAENTRAVDVTGRIGELGPVTSSTPPSAGSTGRRG